MIPRLQWPKPVFKGKQAITSEEHEATAAEHETRRARELGASIHASEIVMFDKAYVDFDHLANPAAREVFWGTRAKGNPLCRVARKFQDGTQTQF